MEVTVDLQSGVLAYYYAPPLIGGGIKRCFCLTSDVCLTSVCLSVAYIGPNWRTERPRKTKIGTDVAHITRDSDNTFKVKRLKVKVTRPLWLVVLVGQHGHTVMATYPYAYMTYIVSPFAGLGGGISWRPPADSLLLLSSSSSSSLGWFAAIVYLCHQAVCFCITLMMAEMLCCW